ncbi:hypothetical protein BDS110ZK4_60960 [Bradyrhizobium diazoefficiens]
MMLCRQPFGSISGRDLRRKSYKQAARSDRVVFLFGDRHLLSHGSSFGVVAGDPHNVAPNMKRLD